jgi:DNA-binding IclR family transcriptional regulator
MLSTVENVGRVLSTFDSENPELGVTEVARLLELPKSNVHALLTSLVAIGLIDRTPRSRYRLGWELLVLSERMQGSAGVQDVARPVIRDLAKRARETTFLVAQARDHVVYVDRAEGTHPVVRLMGARVGSTLPMHCTAAGKVFLAEMSPTRALETLGTEEFPRRTTNTITTWGALSECLTRVRREGVAYDLRECVADGCCIAAPIRDRSEQVVAALSVSVPAYRFDASSRTLRECLLEAAQEAEDLLSESPSARPAVPHHEPVPAV